jgi:hypothetical protein
MVSAGTGFSGSAPGQGGRPEQACPAGGRQIALFSGKRLENSPEWIYILSSDLK